jgi:hypothetical protein
MSGLQGRDYIREVERPLDEVGDVGQMPSEKPAASAKNHGAIDQWIGTCMAHEKRIKELETELAASSVTQIKDLKAQIKARDQRIAELNMANLSRPNFEGIVNRVLCLRTGLRYVTWLADEKDFNRQFVCGMHEMCRQLLDLCGAAGEIIVSEEQVMELLTSYYATMTPRQIEAAKSWGLFHTQPPALK